MAGFHQSMLQKIIDSLGNNYKNNIDPELSILSKKVLFRNKLLWFISNITKLLGKNSVLTLFNKNNYFLENIDAYEATYDFLDDLESQDRMIELLAFLSLSYTKVRLSLNNDSFWKGRKSVEKYQLSQTLKFKSFRSELTLFDLNDIGYDIKLFFAPNGVYLDFVLQQYNYNDIVCDNNNDIVIDAGACWGDTALYFASRGAKSVYSYEFIPSNIEVFEKNISLNPKYADCIHLVNKAVWSKSNIDLSFEDRGPASRVGEVGVFSGKISTLSIDELVLTQEIDRIDFIKMDIEGAELQALQGAHETIRKFKPKLAISVYHKNDDLVLIPKYIKDLNPDYKFYLDYYTIVAHEIVVYAIDSSDAI